MLARPLLLLSLAASAVLAVPTDKRGFPTVQLDNGTFIGISDGDVNKFLGIPFGKAPVGDLRFNLPEPVDPYTGIQTATAYGPACPQQAFDSSVLSGLPKDTVDFIVNGFYNIVSPSDEDCLSINIVVPAGTKPNAKLPVAVWIFGGGFEIGGTNTYDGGIVVQRSVALGEPVIFVSMNYRVSAYGFLASQEVQNAGVGNLGLQDQRLALRWIQKHISAFGGDPTKVTIWGESSGAISVALQMVTNGGNTEGLFRGAFMQSGSPIPVGDLNHGQGDYDAIVAQTGCSGASDTLQCLRHVPFETLKKAVDKSPGIFSFRALRLTWLPRMDGKFLTDWPQKLVQKGQVAKIPFVNGDCDDEGTLFSLSLRNITTDHALEGYMRGNYLPDISQTDMASMLALYPDDTAAGSPFGTGLENALTPQFKRVAAIQGDLVFQAPRRFFLQHTSGKQPTWAFLNKRLKGLPVLGSAHATDLLNVFGGGDMTDYLINFVNRLDPNGPTGIPWPQYTTSAPKLLTFLDGATPLAITDDDYRVDAMKLLTKVSLEFPI
ncbi:carotenoid ester lipase precursor [Daedaleopsis nitida]|nr:carotenoid ester lipase precursor [Daedaleopsis nitida]